ncbi:MAG: ATP-binding protein [candidate division KSB1 bacterium]
MDKYLNRTLESALAQRGKDFPAILVTGPRQSGKTTLLQHTFGQSHRFVALDEPDIRALALADPRLFVSQNPPPVIFDEIQYAPELFHYIKRDIDEHRREKARYVLSGSQNLPLMQNVTETLAGRIAVLTLLSMSQAERSHQPQRTPLWEKTFEAAPPAQRDDRVATGEQIMAEVMRGGFPELIIEPDREARAWFAAYVQTYLERDIRSIRNIGNLADFQRFLLALAAQTAQLLNISALSRDLGIAVNTVKAWLSLLEASFQIVLLKPYYVNLGKRLVKAPKLYFLDAALPAYLTGLVDPKHALRGPMGGPLFENAVFAELFRAFVHRGESSRIFFWRTAAGHEVDFILDFGTHLIPIETKLTATPTPAMAANLTAFSALFPKQVSQSFLICLAQRSIKLTGEITVVPFGLQ